MTAPTKLILLRILLIPLFLVLFLNNLEFGRIAALIIFIIAAITDLFDGIVARKYNQVTYFYRFMDPLADKMLICSTLIAMVYTHDIAAWFVILIVCRDFIITGLRLFAATQDKVCGAVITGKFNTAFQMILIVFILANFAGPITDIIKQSLIWIIVGLTIISTIENFVQNKDVIKKIEL